MRLIPPIDRYPRIVALSQKPAGAVVLLMVFAGLLCLAHFPGFVEAALLLASMTFLPAHRRSLLTASVVYWAIAHPILDRRDVIAAVVRQERLGTALDVSRIQVVVLLATLALLGLVTMVVFRWNRSPLVRRPLLILHVSYGLLLLWTCWAPLSGLGRVMAWAFTAILGGFLWYFGYTLLDRRSEDRDPVHLQIGTYFPFWAGAIQGSLVPFVKGAAYLRKIEAKTSEEAAIFRLKGIKLIVWALLLRSVLSILTLLIHGRGDGGPAARLAGHLWPLGSPNTGLVPTFDQAFARSVGRNPYAWYICWTSLVAHFFEELLELTVSGGVVVACCRMAGFRALRNTWRPLQARSIADFWNRYYFYFKEMLVDFFFYPTFIRYFKRHRRTRVLVATFAAAGLGNAEYHFLRDPGYIVDLGLRKALAGFHVYAFYALVLAVGIGVSQIRSPRRAVTQRGWLRARLLAPAGVVLFYCVLSIFDDTTRTHGIQEHFRFFLHLFNVV